jgi:hypothetical protein
MPNTGNGRVQMALLATVPEACFYDDHFDQIIVIGRNAKLENVRTTLQLTDENASKLYHMLGAALTDMGTIRRVRIPYAS